MHSSIVIQGAQLKMHQILAILGLLGLAFLSGPADHKSAKNAGKTNQGPASVTLEKLDEEELGRQNEKLRLGLEVVLQNLAKARQILEEKVLPELVGTLHEEDRDRMAARADEVIQIIRTCSKDLARLHSVCRRIQVALRVNDDDVRARRWFRDKVVAPLKQLSADKNGALKVAKKAAVKLRTILEKDQPGRVAAAKHVLAKLERLRSRVWELWERFRPGCGDKPIQQLLEMEAEQRQVSEILKAHYDYLLKELRKKKR
jgi:hypothetical protein